MNSKSNQSNQRQAIWKILVILLFVFCFVSTSGATHTSASSLNDTPVIDLVRQNMLDTAYLYANHRWTAKQGRLDKFMLRKRFTPRA